MGSIFRYTCNTCRYTEDVSGGEDFGFFTRTKTGVCVCCNRLIDVVIEDNWSDEEEKRKPPRLCLHCKQLVNHWWTEGELCPICKGEMVNMKLVGLWD